VPGFAQDQQDLLGDAPPLLVFLIQFNLRLN